MPRPHRTVFEKSMPSLPPEFLPSPQVISSHSNAIAEATRHELKSNVALMFDTSYYKFAKVKQADISRITVAVSCFSQTSCRPCSWTSCRKKLRLYRHSCRGRAWRTSYCSRMCSPRSSNNSYNNSSTRTRYSVDASH